MDREGLLILEVTVAFGSSGSLSQNPLDLVFVEGLLEIGARGANFPSVLLFELFSFLLFMKFPVVTNVEVSSVELEALFFSFSIRSRNYPQIRFILLLS
jgi:hypothetical protein